MYEAPNYKIAIETAFGIIEGLRLLPESGMSFISNAYTRLDGDVTVDLAGTVTGERPDDAEFYSLYDKGFDGLGIAFYKREG